MDPLRLRRSYNLPKNKFYALLLLDAPEDEILVRYNRCSSDWSIADNDDSPAAASSTTSNQTHTLFIVTLSCPATTSRHKDNEQVLVDVLTDVQT